MTITKPARQEFGRMLTALRKRVERPEVGSLTACATAAGVTVETVKRWCEGETSPRQDNTANVKSLVVHLLQAVGEPAEFGEEWCQALQAAQWEGEDQRGTSKGRGKRRLALALYGAEEHAGSSVLERKAELAVMEGFFDTTDEATPYLWWQAPPRAGASVLLTRFLIEPPENADVVGYFVSRTKDRNRSDHFVGAMVRQLMPLLRKRAPRVPEKVAPATLQEYFRAAAARSAKNGRRLLVVVDGLDQDVAWRDGASKSDPTGISIASLLPHEPVHLPTWDKRPNGRRTLRVIVSSRPAVEPPIDVPADHPLRRADIVRTLAPSAHAKGTASAARDELSLLRASELGRTVVGLLAVARSGLTASDLAQLTNTKCPEVERLLVGEQGRCLVPVDLDVGSYALGGEELVRVAQEESGQEVLAHCAELLHVWADSWQARAWPRSTPRYLLSHYPGLLSGTGRLVRYALDPHRQLRLVAEGLVDEALAQLDHALDESRDLGVASRVALARSVLSQRARLVPREFPRLFALAGDIARARNLALSPPREAARAVRLADVAEVLTRKQTKAGEPSREKARAVAREAAVRAKRATAAGLFIAEPDAHMDALAQAGIALHACGQVESGRAVLRAVISCEAVGWVYRVRAALTLGGAENVGWLVKVAEHAEALSMRGPREQAEALEIWGELAKWVPNSDKTFQALIARYCAVDPIAKDAPKGAAAVRQRIESYCTALDPASDVTHIDLLALGASALASNRRHKARQLALLARKALLDAFADPRALSPADSAHLNLELSTTLARVVQALHDAEQREQAADLPNTVPDELRWDVLGGDVQEQALTVLEKATSSSSTEEAGALMDEEFRSIEEALKTHHPRGRHLLTVAFGRWEGYASTDGTQGWRLPLAHALAAAGHADAAARLVGHSRDTAERAGSLAVVSMGCAAGQHRTEAMRYAQEAAQSAADLPDLAVRGLVAQAFAHAGAVGPAEKWTGWDSPTGRDRQQIERSRAAVAVGLAAHNPEAAARIVEEQLTGVNRMARLPGRERHLSRMLGLLLALPDPRRPSTGLRAALQVLCARVDESVLGWDMHAVLLHGLLDTSHRIRRGGDSLEADLMLPVLGDRLVHWEQYMASTPLPDDVLPVAEWAVLHALRGDIQAARAAAGRSRSPEVRAAALAAVATYLAGVTVIVPAMDGWTSQHTSVLRYLALADAFGTDASRNKDEASRLVREVLAGEHWRYVLPLLPQLAPEAVPRLAESALVYASGCR